MLNLSIAEKKILKKEIWNYTDGSKIWLKRKQNFICLDELVCTKHYVHGSP